MRLVGAGGQQLQHYLYSVDGTITSGGTPQLVLPRAMSRSQLILQNTSPGPLRFEFGSARATATITNGAVTGITITNAGFNFTNPPVILFLGGGGVNPTASTFGAGSPFLGGSLPGYPAPSNVARAHAVLAGGAVNSIVIDNPGSGYLCAPYVFIYNSDLDPFGAAVPSASSGILLAANEQFMFNGTCCTTDPVSVFGASTGQGFVARWMD